MNSYKQLNSMVHGGVAEGEGFLECYTTVTGSQTEAQILHSNT